MRVLIVSSDYLSHIGGKSTHITMLIGGLRSLGHEVTFIYPKRDLISRIAVGMPGKIFDFVGVGVFVRHFMLRNILKISVLRVAMKEDFDVINAEDSNSILAVHSIRPRIPKVLTIHGELARELKTHGYVRNKFQYNLFLRLEKKAYEVADLIVTVDSRLKEYVESQREGTAQKTRVIYNFIDVISFKNEIDALKAEQIKNQFNIPFNRKIILVPRRLVEKCGVMYAVKSAEILIKQHNITDVAFLIIGSGPEHKKISDYIAIANLPDRVVLVGEVNYNDMPKYYRIANVVLIPSINVEGYKEATSLVALEAMAAKVPIVASNIGGLTEIIKDDETGFLVPEKDAEAITKAIKTILENPAVKESIIDNAFKYVMENHHYENAAKAFVGIYDEAIKN